MAYSLTYSYNSALAAYAVTGWANITLNDMVAIPERYNDGINGEHPVKSIGNRAFANCTNLTNITIPDSVTGIGEFAFENCKSLTSITIPDSVTSIGEFAFANCYYLINVIIGNGVTSIGKAAFYVCRSLTSVIIPDSVTSIGEFAFANCSKLKTFILFPKTPPTLGAANAIPSIATDIYVPQVAKKVYQGSSSWGTFADKIKTDNLYLSFARFNIENKKYISQQIQLLKEYIDGRL